MSRGALELQGRLSVEELRILVCLELGQDRGCTAPRGCIFGAVCDAGCLFRGAGQASGPEELGP